MKKTVHLTTMMAILWSVLSASASAQAPVAPTCPAGTTLQNGMCVGAPSPAFATGPVAMESRPTWGLVVAGLITFGVVYVTTVAVTAAISEDGGDIGLSAIPLAGPWILTATTDGYAGALVPSGILQLSGLVLTILGLAIRRHVPVYADGPLRLEPMAAVGPSGAVSAGLNATWQLD